MKPKKPKKVELRDTDTGKLIEPQGESIFDQLAKPLFPMPKVPPFFPDMKGTALGVLMEMRDWLKEVEASRQRTEQEFWGQLLIDEVDKLKREKDELAKELIEKDKLLKLFTATARKVERMKTNVPPTKKVMTLNETIEPQLIRQIHTATSELFEATYEQWENLFSKDIQTMQPIRFKKDTTLADLREILMALEYGDVLPHGGVHTTIERVKAFEFNLKHVSATQLNEATRTISKQSYLMSSRVSKALSEIRLPNRNPES